MSRVMRRDAAVNQNLAMLVRFDLAAPKLMISTDLRLQLQPAQAEASAVALFGINRLVANLSLVDSERVSCISSLITQGRN